MALCTVTERHSTTGAPTGGFDQGLARKTVSTEALVTSWRRSSDTTQTVTVQWPQQHSFYTVSTRYSPLLVIESLRQALAVLTHTVHDIPLSHRLGWEHIRSTVDPEALWAGPTSPSVELTITHTKVKRRPGGSVHLASQVEATRDGVALGEAELHYTTHPPAIYNRLRGRYADARQAFAQALPLTPPVPPAHVGRSSVRDVVLSPTSTAHQWQLRVDTTHTVLFDHPHDHVPGMVLLEAADQIARAEAQPQAAIPVAFDTTFHRYVEFDRPCVLTAEPVEPDAQGRSRVLVSAFQADQVVFRTTVTTEPSATR
ncbi:MULTISPECIES: ScbA/BarX family gamma-butyrolactone biosynthesis protein [Streptomyces]|nr:MULTISPECIES: ScbA/BarX family gamma-butyrolactone biosynthesis protein [Streptomyces]ONI53242.1 A-factor biosynthesis hotdog domain protein [Streptomyces sp. IB2014 011-1]CAD5925361.1 A-factor biosynthesis protein AfsA [Streptomyces sp. KY70]CAD5990330.1 A-factor biosynthesis protein AfsA [Streptomyces sp. KY75]